MNEMRWGGGMGEQSSTPEPVRERQSLPRGRDCLSRRILRGTCQRWRNPRTYRSRRRGSCSWPSLFGRRSSAVALRPSPLAGRRAPRRARPGEASRSRRQAWRRPQFRPWTARGRPWPPRARPARGWARPFKPNRRRRVDVSQNDFSRLSDEGTVTGLSSLPWFDIIGPR